MEALKSANNCYIVTELCEQGSLLTLLKRRGSLNEQEAYNYIHGILQGLRFLSQQGIVHRDLKPSNIFLKDGTVKIADFGFAVKTR